MAPEIARRRSTDHRVDIFAAGAILYDTSKVLLHYHTDQHVGASLQLFASVALLFWYILRIVMRMNRR